MPKQHQLILSFNAGEVGPQLDQRIDQEKHAFGCRTMENFIPTIYGAAERRPGTKYIAEQNDSSAKGRVVGFEHSVDDTYILLFENQRLQFFRNGAVVTKGVGTEDISALNNIVAHYLMNETSGTSVADDDGNTHDGVLSVDSGTITTTGYVGTGCFDLDGQYDITVSDHNDFSFTDNADDSAFSIVVWAYVVEQGGLQVLMSKWRDQSTTREWRFSLASDRKLQLHLCDTSTDLTGDYVAQWYMNDDAASTHVDEVSTVHDGVCTVNTDTISETGKINDCLNLGGTAYVTVTDHAALSFGDGTNDSAFSIAAWIYVTDAGTQDILTKFDSTLGANAREWRFFLNSAEWLSFEIYDESTNGFRLAYTDSPLSTGWHHVVCTYSGVGGANAQNGMNLYVDGSAAVLTRSGYGSYTAMENLTTDVLIGAYRFSGAGNSIFADKIDNVTLFKKELNASEVSSLYNDGNGTESLTPGMQAYCITDSAVSIGWHQLGCTYSAPADSTTAADGIILYVDGVAVSSTATNNTNYTAMQNGAEEVRIGSQRNSGDSANENFWEDKIDELSIYSDVLTPTEVASLYSTTPYSVTTPYLTADLFGLKFEQSADVMYITHPDYEPRKLSRTGHVLWTLEATDIQTGPFLSENDDTTKTLTASATTGDITLTATGHSPFYEGTTAGHQPSGSAVTSKSQTGALFKLVHATDTPSVSAELDATSLNDASSTLTVPEGVTWDYTTNGTWGAAGDSASVVLERSYDSGTTYETVVTVTSAANKNITTSGTESFADAIYRARVSDAAVGGGTCSIQFSIRDTSHIGIVEITSVTSPTVALATVLKTLGSTDLTHRWSEGSFSNYRGWPIDVTISSEERLTFVGSASYPLTVWGSTSGDFTDFSEGTDDDDAITFALVGTGQQNRIRWVIPRDALVIGTVGGVHLLGASKDDEALTPTNVRARLQTTKGSENVAALMINQAILYVERGGRKIRELLYDYQSDSHKADDLTVFANHITDSGIADMAYQRTPDPILWCVRDDGQLAIMSYERDQKVFAWSRIVTADSTSDSEFESVAVIYGGANSEDEVWVTVKRTINSSTVRYVERFKTRDWGSDDEDAFFADSGLTYDSTAASTVTAAHLKGETCSVFADGNKFDDAVANASTGVITLKKDGVATTASVVQYGLAYTSTLKPMKLNIANLGLATTKKITRGIISLYKTMRGQWGQDAANTNPFKYREAGETSAEFPMFTGDIEMDFEGDSTREGDIVIKQTDPVPMTVLAVTLDVGVNND